MTKNNAVFATNWFWKFSIILLLSNKPLIHGHHWNAHILLYPPISVCFNKLNYMENMAFSEQNFGVEIPSF